VRWTQAFAAEDLVKKVVVSAGQGILLIAHRGRPDLAEAAALSPGRPQPGQVWDVERRDSGPASMPFNS
jgi:hypothetical protein